MVHYVTDTHGCRTTGGAGGTETTVTTVEEFQAAAGAEGPGIIFVEGSITGGARVDVGSDKTIIGKAGSCASLSANRELDISG